MILSTCPQYVRRQNVIRGHVAGIKYILLFFFGGGSLFLKKMYIIENNLGSIPYPPPLLFFFWPGKYEPQQIMEKKTMRKPKALTRSLSPRSSPSFIDRIVGRSNFKKKIHPVIYVFILQV